MTHRNIFIKPRQVTTLFLQISLKVTYNMDYVPYKPNIFKIVALENNMGTSYSKLQYGIEQTKFFKRRSKIEYHLIV